MIRYPRLLALIAALAIHSQASAISTSVTEIKDTRTTGKFFAGCEVEVTLVGDELADVQGFRTTLTAVTDDTGRDLRQTDKENTKFESKSQYSGDKVTLKLKNPARKASVIKEITGEIELYSPKNDPSSTVAVPFALSQSGKMISQPALTQNKIQLTLFTAVDYASHRKAEMEKQALAQGMQNALGNMFKDTFGGSTSNDVTFVISDPNHRIVDFDFYAADGTEIKSSGSMSSTSDTVITKTLSFRAAIPADAKLKISLVTEKAVVKVPLHLVDIGLP